MRSATTEEPVTGRIDRVFSALADATRRSLLDRLYDHDGQRLGQLAEGFAISRQAIGKHLEVLVDAGLVVPDRESRETRYFLNRAPLRAAQSEWIEKFTRLVVRVDCS